MSTEKLINLKKEIDLISQKNQYRRLGQKNPPKTKEVHVVAIILPKELQTQMNRCEITLYNLLTPMIQRQARKSPRKAMYCYPSQGWLAKQLGYSRSWICKCLKRLDALGILLKTQRHKIKGRFRSCLYRFGENLWKALGRIQEALRTLALRVNKTAHISLPHNNIKKNKNENLKLNPLETGRIENNLTHVREIIKKLS